MDLGTKLERNAREFPDKTAINFKDRQFSYAQVIMERFDPVDALRLMERYRTTFSSMAPIMFNRIMRVSPQLFETYDVSSTRCFIQSSSPIRFPT